MLTLTREVGEKIVIGDDIVITIVSVSESGRVRLGIDAPRQIRIDREEVLERVRKENVEAGGLKSDHLEWAAYAARQANRRSAPRGAGPATAPGRTPPGATDKPEAGAPAVGTSSDAPAGPAIAPDAVASDAPAPGAPDRR